jgi:hypothetical protein
MDRITKSLLEEFMAPQKNLWVNCGSGKFPSV